MCEPLAAAAAALISRIRTGQQVSRTQMKAAFLPILEAGFLGADVAWGALLGALHTRGPAVGELLGLVDAIQHFDPELCTRLQRKVELETPRAVVAVTGSGKDTFKTFNVSTAAAFMAAAHPEVLVVKPAGQATSATTGAADVLNALGVRLPVSLEDAATLAVRTGMCLFDYHLVAPRYGPRYEGRFHHLHPLSYVTRWLFIPFAVEGIVFGVSDPQTELAARTMMAVGVRRAAVVTTSLGPHRQIDELAPFGASRASWVEGGAVDQQTRTLPIPDDLSAIVQRPSHAQNAELIADILQGRGPRMARDLVCANAALLLRIAGAVSDDRATEMAEDLIASGAAYQQLCRCIDVSSSESAGSQQ